MEEGSCRGVKVIGKKKDDFTWLSERLDYLTKNDTFKSINSGNGKYISTFRAGAWTILKEMMIAYYSPSYIQILKNQSHIDKVCYLDLFAGSGIVEIEGLSKYYLGSPLVVTKAIRNKFDEYFFFEKDEAKTKQLENLLANEPATIIKGDSNVSIDGILKSISSLRVHSLVFIDPFAMEIKFETIKKFAHVGCDFVITVATEEIFRAVKQWFGNPSWNSTQVNDFFGGEEWKSDLKNIHNDEEIFNYYSDRVVNYAFKKKPKKTKIEKAIGGHHYYVLFTSTGGKGEQPKFFDIIDDFNRRIKNLSGDEILNYLSHYVEGGGSSLRDFFA